MEGKKIKVIHFIDRIARGGTQAVLFDWLSHIDSNRFEFDFLVFMDGQTEYIEKFKEKGCNIFQLPKLSVRNIHNFTKSLDDFFSTHNYDIAHGHSKSKNLFFLAAAKKHDIKIRIAHSHNTQFQKMAFIGEIMKPLLKIVSTDYAACSDYAAKWLFGNTLWEKGKIKIINNGVDTNKFTFSKSARAEMRRALNLEEMFVVGHIGKYMEQKNHLYLLEIFSEIKKIHDNSALLLVGDGYDDIKKAVQEKIVALGIEDSVKQLGLRQDVPDLMQAMDVFLLPSLYEGLPVVGVEAQAAGLPCYISDTVTKQVSILNSTYYMSIDVQPEYWAKAIMDGGTLSENERYEAAKIVSEAGFESFQVAGELEKYYIELLGRSKCDV